MFMGDTILFTMYLANDTYKQMTHIRNNTTKQTAIRHCVWGTHSRHFTCIYSFNSYNNTLILGTMIISTSDEEMEAQRH